MIVPVKLRWVKKANETPYGPTYVGFLGRIVVATVQDENERDPIKYPNFVVYIALPVQMPDSFFCEPEPMTNYKCRYFRLPHAQAAAERLVTRWLKRAGLKQDAARNRRRQLSTAMGD